MTRNETQIAHSLTTLTEGSTTGVLGATVTFGNNRVKPVVLTGSTAKPGMGASVAVVFSVMLTPDNVLLAADAVAFGAVDVALLGASEITIGCLAALTQLMARAMTTNVGTARINCMASECCWDRNNDQAALSWSHSSVRLPCCLG